jgi:hypothetical protein
VITNEWGNPLARLGLLYTRGKTVIWRSGGRVLAFQHVENEWTLPIAELGVLKSNLNPIMRKWGEQRLETDALVNAPSAEEFVSDIQHKSGLAALKISDESRVGACVGNERGP